MLPVSSNAQSHKKSRYPTADGIGTTAYPPSVPPESQQKVKKKKKRSSRGSSSKRHGRKTPRNNIILTLVGLWAQIAACWALYMLVFACPPDSRLDAHAPAVCRRGDALKVYLEPHVRPHYDTYVQPHIDSLRPYYDQTMHVYHTYGHPIVSRAQVYGQRYVVPSGKAAQRQATALWMKRVQPVFNNQYEKYLASHVNAVTTTYRRHVQPVVIRLQKTREMLYDSYIDPMYRKIRPYLDATGARMQHYYMKYAHPRVQRIGRWFELQYRYRVFPQIRLMYYKHFAPQMLRLKSFFPHRSKANSIIKNAQETISSVSATDAASMVAEPTPVSDDLNLVPEAEQRSSDAKVIRATIETWRQKIKDAEDEAIQFLNDQSTEVFGDWIHHQSEICGDLTLQLEGITERALFSIESLIISEASATTDESEERLIQKTRESGQEIRDGGVEIRSHVQDVRNEWVARQLGITNQAVAIVNQVYEAANEAVGKDYASLSVSNQDWINYHQLKDLAMESVKRVEASASMSFITGVDQLKSRTESQVNSISKDAAQKLKALRSVGKDKIIRHDASSDFGKSYIPIGLRLGVDAIKSKAEAVYDAGSSAILGTPTPVTEQILSSIVGAASVVTDAASSVAEYASGQVDAEGAASYAQSLANDAASVVSDAGETIQSSAASIYSDASSFVKEPAATIHALAEDYIASPAASAVSDASAALFSTHPAMDSFVSRASASILGKEPPMASKILTSLEQLETAAEGAAGSAYSAASSAIVGEHALPSQAASAISQQISKASEQVFGTPQGSMESIASVASSAILGESKPTPITESLLSMASKALDHASSAVRGHESQGVAESLASVASEAVFGEQSTTPIIKSIASNIQSAASEATEYIESIIHRDEL